MPIIGNALYLQIMYNPYPKPMLSNYSLIADVIADGSTTDAFNVVFFAGESFYSPSGV